jgi:RNA polymerase sigma-70 factor (ECF subfamily)
MTEQEAIDHCRQGNVEGLRLLFELHRSKVYGLSWRMLGSPHDAEDALQEVYLKVFDRIKNYRGDSAFSTWLYRMTTNHCLDVLRRRKVVPFLGFEKAPEVEDRTAEGAVMDLGLSPAVRRALAKLPEKQRACLLLRETQDLSYEEIAQALEITVGTVKSNLHRAKEVLKDLFAKEGLSPQDL